MTHAPQATALYERREGYIPRVAAIHDLCGYGKCSLGVAIPVLSAAGCDVCPVPTGLFSSHTAFPGWYMHDTTEILNDYLAAWAGIGVELDAVYSGFLGAPEQVDIIKQVWESHPGALRVVDPVMARCTPPTPPSSWPPWAPWPTGPISSRRTSPRPLSSWAGRGKEPM